MAVHTHRIFRLRFCREPECGGLFWICRSCDRGQRYCSPSCRHQARRRQLREANRRHQRSPEGRLDHRDRQRAYRARRRAGVTDQGRRTLFSFARISSREVAVLLGKDRFQEEKHAKQAFLWDWFLHFQPVCAVCGHAGRWVDPFRDWG